MQFRTLMLVATVAFLPVAASAQDAQHACSGADTALPADMAGWTAKSDLGAATSTADLAKAQLGVGHAVTAALHHTSDVSYATQPEKPGGTVAYGGLFGLMVKEAGTYRIGLGSGAWIDVVNRDKKTRSTAHGHGPACSTIRKIVDFPLQPGNYVIQISANADPTLALMVWRKP